MFRTSLPSICHVAQLMLGKRFIQFIGIVWGLGLGLGCYHHYQYSHIYIRIISFHLTFILQRGFEDLQLKLSSFQQVAISYKKESHHSRIPSSLFQSFIFYSKDVDKVLSLLSFTKYSSSVICFA